MATQSTPLLNATQPPQATPALQPFGLRSPAHNSTHSSTHGPSGSWKLAGGCAVTLRDDRAAVLRITHGSVWATVDGPHAGPANNQGDLFLKEGERLRLRPGQRVVIEPWRSSTPCASSVSESVYFSWDPAPQATPLPRNAGASVNAGAPAGSRMQVALVYPLRDFGLALKMAGQALGRLVWGIAGLSEFLTAGRGRALPCMESNPP